MNISLKDDSENDVYRSMENSLDIRHYKCSLQTSFNSRNTI